jgi:hypothetical protein
MNPDEYGDLAEAMSDWFSQASNLVASLKSYPTGEDLKTVFARTLYFATETEGDGHDYVTMFDKFADLIKLLPDVRSAQMIKELGGDPTPETTARIDEIRESAEDYVSSFDYFSKGRLLCVTEKGHLGWVPQGAEAGDCIFALKWCRIPFVLHQETPGYRLIGDCYLHGFMNCEPYFRLSPEAEPIRII